jgi:acyl-CoA reductase-like NAD-dependent aldehyde dehydrogenase
VHKTDAGERRKALQKEAQKLEKEVKALAKVQQMSPAAKIRQDEADRLKADAEALKGAARLEDLHVWQMEKTKTTKKGSRKYTYWIATWREGGKTRNVHLGSCAKMDEEAALQKAKAMKAEALAM